MNIFEWLSHLFRGNVVVSTILSRNNHLTITKNQLRMMYDLVHEVLLNVSKLMDIEFSVDIDKIRIE